MAPGPDQEGVADLEPPGRRGPRRLQDHGSGHVATARGNRPVTRPETEPTRVPIEDCREDARAVHPRERQPLDVPAGRYERTDLAVRQQRVVGDRRMGCRRARCYRPGLRGSAAPARRCDGCARRRSPSGLLPLPEALPSSAPDPGKCKCTIPLRSASEGPQRPSPPAGRIVAPCPARPTAPRPGPPRGRRVPASAAPSSIPTSFLDRSATIHPDRVAVVYGDVRRTYAELRERVNRLASALRARGLEHHDRVAALCPERARAAGAPPRRAGGRRRARGDQHAAERGEVGYILEHSGSRVLFVDRRARVAGGRAAGGPRGRAARVTSTSGSSPTAIRPACRRCCATRRSRSRSTTPRARPAARRASSTRTAART